MPWNAAGITGSLSEPFLTSIVFGAGKFVAVSDNLFLVSTNGLDWNYGGAPGGRTIIYANNLFVIANYDGISTSEDGLTWTRRLEDPLSPPALASVAYGDGLFVAVGGQRGKTSVYSSPDGLTWTDRTIGLPFTDRLIWICHGNGRFITAPDSWESGLLAFTSADGITWERHEQWGRNNACFGKGIFVSCNVYGVETSVDGLNWTNRLSETNSYLGGYGFGSSYANGKFFAIGRGIVSSDDGLNWATNNGSTGRTLRAIAEGNGKIAAVGDAGVVVSAPSPSLTNWMLGKIGPNLDLNSLTFAKGKFIAAGNTEQGACVVLSSDGIGWTLVPQWWVKTTSVAAGGESIIAPNISGWVYACYDSARWDDATYWQRVNTPLSLNATRATPINKIVFANGTFVAVANEGKIINSIDFGRTWRLADSGMTNDLTLLCYGSGKFVAISAKRDVITSSDGVTWTKIPTKLAYDLRDIIYVNGRLVGVADSRVWWSFDGVTWYMKDVAFATPAETVFAMENRFVVAGQFGSILATAYTRYTGPGRFTQIRETAEGMELSIECEPGVYHWLERSTTMAGDSWISDLGLVYAGETAVTNIVVPKAEASADTVFYRLNRPWWGD